jgi:hypothetical protein
MTACPKCHGRNGLSANIGISLPSALERNHENATPYYGVSCIYCGHYADLAVAPVVPLDKGKIARPARKPEYVRPDFTLSDKAVWKYQASVKYQLKLKTSLDTIANLLRRFVPPGVHNTSIERSIERLMAGKLDRLGDEG